MREKLSWADRIPDPWTERLPLLESGFERADELWQSLQNKMIAFIMANGGNAAHYDPMEPFYFLRPKWADVDLYLRNQITIDELRKRIGC